jgi:hypothetical protein
LPLDYRNADKKLEYTAELSLLFRG